MIDAHCHIHHIKENIMQQCIKKNIKVLISGLGKEDCEKVFSIIDNKNSYAYIGIHPSEIKDYTDEQIDDFISYVKKNKNKIIGIGEVGLDYKWDTEYETRKRQADVFKKFILLSKELEIPLVIHSRDSMSDTLDILEKTGAEKIMLHCFSASLTELRRALDIGCFISYATNINWTKKHPKLIEKTPIDRMFLETDSPWLDPDSDISNIKLNNRPWKIEISAETISNILGIPKNEILEKTEENIRKFFNI